MVELPVGKLPRRSAQSSVDREDVSEPLFDRAGAVACPAQPIDDDRRLGPLGIPRPLRQVDAQDRIVVRNHLRESDLPSVRSPPHVGDRPLQVRQLRDFAGIHIQHVQLLAAVAIRQKGNPPRVWCPDRRLVAPAAARQLAHAGSVRAHNPETASRLVLHLVDPFPGKDDVAAIGRDGGIADAFHVEKCVFVKQAGRLGGGSGGHRRKRCVRQHGAGKPTRHNNLLAGAFLYQKP